jgi:TonB family protein
MDKRKAGSLRVFSMMLLLHMAASAVLSVPGIAAATGQAFPELAADSGGSGHATVPVPAAGAVSGQYAGPAPSLVRIAQSATQQSDPGTRPARSNEVRVEVLLLSDKVSPNPEEYIEANGTRYIYFNSPRLAAPARPLMEPKLRYPRAKLERTDGAVVLQLLINEIGALEDASIVCSARGFGTSALESVKGLKFRPAQGKDGPVRSYMLVEFSYGRGFPCIPAPFY